MSEFRYPSPEPPIDPPYDDEPTCRHCGRSGKDLRFGLNTKGLCCECEDLPRCAECGKVLDANAADGAICESCADERLWQTVCKEENKEGEE